MPATGSNVSFKYGLYSNYSALTPDANTFYFCTDTQQFFVGDVEYSRPVSYGTSLPSAFLPPNSLFYNTSTQELYFSKDGESWEAVSNFYTHPTFLAATTTLGSNTSGTLAFGDSITVPSVTVNEEGHVTTGSDATITLPSLTVSSSGDGNAVTDVTAASDGTITVTKGATYATTDELASAISAVTSFSVDTNGGDGYASLSALEAAVPTGEVGVFYLVVSGSIESGNIYTEYFWTGSAYEACGTFGDVDLSGYVPTSRTINGYALTSNITLTADDIGLGNVDNTADADKSVASAAALTTARSLITDLSSTTAASFDGTSDVTLGVSGILSTANGGTGTTTGHIAIATTSDTTSNATPSSGGTFTAIDSVERDEYGHVLSVNTKTVTIPASSDTMVTQTVTTTASDYPLLLAPSGQTATTTTTAYFGTAFQANPSTGTITATTFDGDLTGNAGSADKLSTAHSIQVDLTSTTAADFDGTSDITPGVTGVLPIANGGTGTTTGHIAITQGTNGTDTATLDHSDTFTAITGVTKDSYGHVTAYTTTTYTLPDSDNTDTEVTNTLAATTKAYLTGTTTATTNTGTQVFDTDVYLGTEAGSLYASTFYGDLSGNAATATSATSATQDGNGNVIADTYATLDDVSDAALVWGTF